MVRIGRRRKTIGMCVLSFVAVLLTIVLVMQKSTDSIMTQIEDAFYCTDYYITDRSYRPEEYPEIYAKPDANYVVFPEDQRHRNLYAHFNRAHYFINKSELFSESNIKSFELRRMFTWHNFRSGVLWIKYSVSLVDENDNHVSSSGDIPVRMQIEKVNGEWEVTDIYERP